MQHGRNTDTPNMWHYNLDSTESGIVWRSAVWKMAEMSSRSDEALPEHVSRFFARLVINVSPNMGMRLDIIHPDIATTLASAIRDYADKKDIDAEAEATRLGEEMTLAAGEVEANLVIPDHLPDNFDAPS